MSSFEYSYDEELEINYDEELEINYDEELEIKNYCKLMSSDEINQKYYDEIEEDKSNEPTAPNTEPLEIISNVEDQKLISTEEFSTKKKEKKNIKNNKGRKYDDDNIRSKIKNNFLRFEFNYLNETIKEEFGHQKLLFRKIEYSDLRNKKENKEFIQKKFFEFILENDISSKFKTKDPELNKKHLKKFDLNDNSKVSNFLNLTMESIYNNFFLNKKHEKNKKIVFFDDFIKKLEKEEEDENYIEKIKKIAKENFISYYKNYNEENGKNIKKKFNVVKYNK